MLGDRSFHLVIPERKAGSMALDRFRAWLVAQAAAARSGAASSHAAASDAADSRYALATAKPSPQSDSNADAGGPADVKARATRAPRR
jgi:hypothetical protein